MITVLIPLYNGIEFLEEAVQSILAQTYNDWTVIVGVNGWPSGSEVYHQALRICSIDIRIRVLDLHEIRGKSAALNAMCMHVLTPWVALLDADDVWHPKKLSTQITFLDTYDVIGSQCMYIGERQGTVPYIPLEDITYIDFKQLNPIINSSALIRTSIAHWNEENNILEDYELWLTLRAEGKRFYNVPQILVYHRIHSSSHFNGTNHSYVRTLLNSF
jgi:glycosyltransferase involved in cell wall biosynthesis